MEIETIVDESSFETALRMARDTGTRTKLRSLSAPLQGAMLGWVDEAWDRVEAVLRKAYRASRDALGGLRQEALAAVDSVLAKAGQKASEVEAALREKIEAYLRNFVDGALKRVPAAIDVGGSSLSLAKVQLTHKLVMTGSLKTSLDGALMLTTGGELTVQGEYVRPDWKQA